MRSGISYHYAGHQDFVNSNDESTETKACRALWIFFGKVFVTPLKILGNAIQVCSVKNIQCGESPPNCDSGQTCFEFSPARDRTSITLI
jgi:hypothetical protein